VAGGSLGVHPEDMARHIAYDPGAKGVSLGLGAALNAPVVMSNFSRLVIDPNRGEDDPTLVMRLYDGTIIPGNARIDEAEIERRKQAFYRPYHDAVAHMAARREDVIIVAIHSYTPRLNGRPPRPWHVGILHAADQRLARPLISRLRCDSDLCVGENDPYGGHLP
ncbi:N-formylglutamate amidohydrolase, partial [Escherichia coli]|nr:N-formylglutamate amidohydrolase [Escherichia coli]